VSAAATTDYLVTGAGGQLGRALLAAAAARGARAVGAAHAEVAVEDRAAVQAWIAAERPRAVIHGGAWTDVDGCERDPARAQLVNGSGTGFVAEACRSLGCALLYVSTDFVFDGGKRTPYLPTDPPCPLSQYGRSKLAGEQELLATAAPRFYVVRTSWVFGVGGKSFPRAILNRALAGQPLRVVDDQVGRPTFCADLAVALLDLADSGAAGGIYHAANEGECSWHELAEDVVRQACLDVEVARMKSHELDRPARRPAYSVLDCTKLEGVRGRRLPHYRDALARYLQEELT
jgi:dTDP-4-dehydrorhamnose reductase